MPDMHRQPNLQNDDYRRQMRRQGRKIATLTDIWATRIARAMGYSEAQACAAGRVGRAIAMQRVSERRLPSWAMAAQRELVGIAHVAVHFAFAMDPSGAEHPRTPNAMLREMFDDGERYPFVIVDALASLFRLADPIRIAARERNVAFIPIEQAI